MKETLAYILVLILAGIATIHAQENQTTFSNVEELIAIALNNNSDLNVYLLQQKKATADYNKSKNFYLPTMSGTAGFQNNLALATTTLPGEIFGQPGESVNTQIGQKYNYNLGVNLSMILFDREKKINVKVSKISTQIAAAQTEIFKQTLKEQTAFYYYSTLIGQQAVEISREDFRISDSIYQLTVNKYEEGLIDITVKNQSEINRNKVQQSILSNENIYNQSLNNLKLILGIDSQTTINLTENIGIQSNIPLGKVNLNEDKSIALKVLQEEQSELRVNKEESTFLPKLSINGYLGKQQLSDDIGVSFKSDSWTNYSYINVGFSVPIFSGFFNKNRLEMAKIDTEIAVQNFTIEKEKSSVKDAQLLAEYNRNLAILESSKNNFLLSKENTDLAMLKYEQGLLSLDAYFKLYEDYLKAENNYLNSLSITFSQYATILSRS